MSANCTDIRRPSTPVSSPGANGGDHGLAAPQLTVGPGARPAASCPPRLLELLLLPLPPRLLQLLLLPLSRRGYVS